MRCPPRFRDPIFDPDCRLARLCTCTSLCLQMATLGPCKHAQMQFCSRFTPGTSSSSMLRDEPPRQSGCCRSPAFLAKRDSQVTATSHDRRLALGPCLSIVRLTRLLCTAFCSCTNTSYWSECSMTTLCPNTSPNAKMVFTRFSLNSFVGHSIAEKLPEPTSTALREGIGST